MATLAGSNVNVNVNVGTVSGGSGSRSGVRFNTQEFRKLINPALDIVPEDLGAGANKYPPFPEHWDPILRSYVYLQEFTENNPNWFNALKAVATGHTSSRKMNKTQLQAAVLEMIDAAPEREARFAEIVDQHDGEGAINYWLGMLRVDPRQHPWTHLMIRIAQRVGESVVMCLKDDFRAPRPSQLCPALVPMIDPPLTPSFPAGHALQSYLISYCLQDALPKIPQSAPPAIPTDPHLGLFALAERVADNRVIAGLHFRVDNAAGEAVAKSMLPMLKTNPNPTTDPSSYLNDVIPGVRGEFPQYAP
jgi:hypothetical protein